MNNSMNMIHCYIDQGLNFARPVNWTGRVRRQRRGDSRDMDQTAEHAWKAGTLVPLPVGEHIPYKPGNNRPTFSCISTASVKSQSSCRLYFFWGFSPWPPQYTRRNFFIFACVCGCISVCRSQTATSTGIFYVLSTHFFSIFETESYRNQEVSQTSALLLMPGIVSWASEGWWEKLGLFQFNPWKIDFQNCESGPCRYSACSQSPDARVQQGSESQTI